MEKLKGSKEPIFSFLIKDAEFVRVEKAKVLVEENALTAVNIEMSKTVDNFMLAKDGKNACNDD